MNGIESITGKIIGDAKEYEAEMISKAEAEAQTKLTECQFKCDWIEAEADRKISALTKQYDARLDSMIDYEDRNIMLAKKGDMIDSVFEEAKKRIASLPKKEYMALLSELLEEVIEQLHTDLLANAYNDGDEYETSTNLELFLNARDAAEYGKRLIAKGKTYCKELFNITLGKTAADLPGGFILRRGSIEINCNSDLLVEQIRSSLEGEVGEILFSD